MQISTDFVVTIFYKYVPIEDPEKLEDQLRDLCKMYDVKCRIILAKEGINATAGGLKQNVEDFNAELAKLPGFSDIDFKYSPAEFNAFPKVKIKVRDEIVTLGPDAKDIEMQRDNPAKHIDADDLEKMYINGEEFYVLDARNNYETKIGKFKNTLDPGIENFRDFPKKIEEYAKEYGDKKIVMVCTSGVRCEKATAYALKNGFKEVYQLHGGMQRYLEKYPKSNFEGPLYVFDDRIAINFAGDESNLNNCEYCNKKPLGYKNCFNSKCNKRIIACDECFKQNEGCCCAECKEIKHPRKVKFRFEEKL